MADPHFKVTIGVTPPDPTTEIVRWLSGGLKAVGADFQPTVSLVLYEKTEKRMLYRLFGPRTCPLIAGADASWEALGSNPEVPTLPPGEYLLVALAFGSPGSDLIDEDRASFTVAAPPL
jgi:hypothetical protein